MPWSGGTFQRARSWVADKAANLKIRADLHDAHDDDIATGLQSCLKRDGTNSPSANIDLGGFTFTNVGPVPTGWVTFPAGTRLIFQQTAAPTGWTKETGSNFSDAALRGVTGTVSDGYNTGQPVSVAWANRATSNGSSNNINVVPTTPPANSVNIFHTHDFDNRVKWYDVIVATKQ